MINTKNRSRLFCKIILFFNFISTLATTVITANKSLISQPRPNKSYLIKQTIKTIGKPVAVIILLSSAGFFIWTMPLNSDNLASKISQISPSSFFSKYNPRQKALLKIAHGAGLTDPTSLQHLVNSASSYNQEVSKKVVIHTLSTLMFAFSTKLLVRLVSWSKQQKRLIIKCPGMFYGIPFTITAATLTLGQLCKLIKLYFYYKSGGVIKKGRNTYVSI